MESDDPVVLLALAPATAYREFLYRPGGRLARWIDARFVALATPGRPVPPAVRAGDLLLEVPLGHPTGGRCVILDGALAPPELSRRRLPPGYLLLRPRRPAQLSEPEPVEPSVDRSGEPGPGTDTWSTAPALDVERPEHDFGDEADGGTAVHIDRAAAVPPFTPSERAQVREPLLSAQASAGAVVWTRRMHPAVSGLGIEDIRAALSGYVDAAAVQAAIERRKRHEPGQQTDVADDAVLVECVHQFQVKCYRDPREHDGRAGESTLDSLGLVVRSGSGFRGADRGNAAALRRLRGVDTRIGELTSHEFSAATWFDAMGDPSVFGWRTKLGNGLHLLLIRRLRQAERYLLTLPAYRGMTPVALGTALGLTEPHGGARPSQSTSMSVHTFGLAIDIAYRANPWIHDTASWRALRHAAALVSGTQLTHGSAPQYFSAIGSSGRSTGEIWDEMQRRNHDLVTYFRLGEDAPALRAALQLAQVRGTPGVVEVGETVDRAAARWHATIQQDRDDLAGGDFRQHEPPGNGFLSLPRDLVIALRDHACLAWGAVDLGPGSRGSGDIMHFDARVGGVGQLLAAGVNFVPTTGHPCLSVATAPVAAGAAGAPDPGSREVPNYLGGRLWTFVPESYGLPVAVFCPKAALTHNDVEVLFFAHGLLHGCPRLAHVPAGFVTDRPFALGPIVDTSGRPLVLVVPLLDWAHPGGEAAFGRGHERWHVLARPDRFNALVDDVLGELGRVRGTARPEVSNLIIAGHSRAYDFLEPLADSRLHGAMHRGALATLSQLWAFDTTYSGRVSNWTDWLAINPHLRVEVFYRPGSPTATVGDEFYRRRRAGLNVNRVDEHHCDVPAARLGRLLQSPRAEAAEAATDALPTAGELTNRIARCIGIWETNRGGDDPAPRESTLDTVAGVHASLATLEQATMPYAITVLKRHKSLRDRARPPLRLAELRAADARVTAVAALLRAVAAAAEGTRPDDFIAGNTLAIGATGLVDDDVRTMFRAERLRASLGQARAEAAVAARAAAEEAAAQNKSVKEQQAAAQAARQKSLAASLRAISDRLGLGDSSLRVYVTRPETWGENRAGWQRKAVEAMPDDIGRRIKDVAVSDSGTALAIPTIRSRVDAELQRVPPPAIEEIVRSVAQQNNPHEAGYGQHVWETYQRIYLRSQAEGNGTEERGLILSGQALPPPARSDADSEGLTEDTRPSAPTLRSTLFAGDHDLAAVAAGRIRRLDDALVAGESPRPRPAAPPVQPQPESADQRVSRWVSALGPRLRPGNEVTGLVDGPETLAAYLAALRTATGPGHFIYLLGWWLDLDVPLDPAAQSAYCGGRPTRGATTMRTLLRAADASGVQVRVMLWDQTGSSQNTAEVRYVNDLSHGAAMLDNNQIAYYAGSQHQKLLIVGGSAGVLAFCGGIDINPDRICPVFPARTTTTASSQGDAARRGGNAEVATVPQLATGVLPESSEGSSGGGGGRPLHDVHVRISGPAADDLVQVFVHRWYANPEHRPLDRRKGPLLGLCQLPSPVRGQALVRVDQTFSATYAGPRQPVRDCTTPPPLGPLTRVRDRGIQDTYLTAIGQARRFIYWEDQYMVNMCAAEFLRRALAHVEFIILLMADSTISDLPHRWAWRKRFIQHIRRDPQGSKLHVFTLRDATTGGVGPHTYVHAKTIMVDDELAIIGSANCNRRGWESDTEVTATIVGDLDVTGRPFASRIRQRLWAEHLGVPPALVEDPIASAALWWLPSSGPGGTVSLPNGRVINLAGRRVRPYDVNAGTDGLGDSLIPDDLVDPPAPVPGSPCGGVPLAINATDPEQRRLAGTPVRSVQFAVG